MTKTIRTLAVLASASLVLGAFVAGPADAKKRKKKAPAGCAAYVPGENAADQKVNVVTDAHTADAPLTLDVTLAPGLGQGRDPSTPIGEHVSHVFVPVQVDSAAAAGALYLNAHWVEVPYDYDLYLDDAAGEVVANSAGYGPVDDGSPEDSVHEFGAETIISVDTTDCGGYTLDVVGATTAGGTVTLNLYLGE